MVRYIPNQPTLSLSILNRKKNIDFDFKNPIFYPCARNALYSILNSINLSKTENILFPSYICETPIKSALRFTNNIRFYRITKDLRINFNDFKVNINKNTKAAVIVHYFGFGRDIKKVQSICKKNNIYLIEDCAQSLFSRYNEKLLGSFGDFAFFSLRKSLPLFEGAASISNNNSFNLPANKKRRLSLDYNIYKLEKYLDALNKKINFRLQRSVSTIEKRNKNKLKERKLYSDPSKYAKIGTLTKHIIKNSDSKEIIKQRRKNFSFLLQNLDNAQKIKPIFNSLPEGICPLAFPILAENRTDIVKKLRNSNIEAQKHWDTLIPKEIDRKKFTATDYLAKRELSLPIHQDLNENHMELIIKSILS